MKLGRQKAEIATFAYMHDAYRLVQYSLPGCRMHMAPGGTPPGRVEAKLSRTTPLVRRGKVVQEDWEVV